MSAFREVPGIPYNLSTESRPNYLYISIKSEVREFEMSRLIWTEIADACSQDRCGRIIIDADIPQPLSIADLHWLRRELPKVGVTNCRIAVADRRRKRHVINKFAEIASANREIIIRVFTTPEAAEEWLTEQ